MKKHEIRLVESSLEKTARLFASNYGVKLRFDPKGRAYTDGKVVCVPAIPSDASEDVLEAMMGYVCHEVAHIIFSDWDLLPKLSKEDRIIHYTMMFFEDIRIERKMVERFPGTAHSFRIMASVVFNRLKEQWPKVNSYHRVLASCYLNQRHPGTRFISDFISHEERQVLAAVEGIMSRNPLETSEDAVEIARQVIDLLKPSPDDVLGHDMTVSGAMVKMTGGQTGDGGESPEEQSDDGSGSKEGNQAGPTPMDCAGLILEKMIDEKEFDHSIKQQGIYLPYDRSNDQFLVAPDSNDQETLSDLREQAADLVHVMKTKLVNSLRSVLRRKWQSGKPEGRLDRRKLARVTMGDPNVYMARTALPELDTAIAIAVDHSQSMGYSRDHTSKSHLAAASAVVLGDVLSALKVPFMIYGHSTTPSREFPKDGYGFYSRWNQLWVQVYSRFGENWNNAALRLTHTPTMHNTLDGEALRWGAQQLLSRPEKRKVLFWLNDGWPEPGDGNQNLCKQHVHDVVAACQKAGIEVIAFGIQCDDVKRYYPQHIVIHDLSDLVKEPLTKLDAILRHAAQ